MPFSPPPAGSSGGTASVIVLDEGSAVGTASGTAIFNFVGAGVAATYSGGTATVTVAGGTAAGSIITLDEGTNIGTPTVLNIVGAGATASYSGGTTTITVAGASGTAIPNTFVGTGPWWASNTITSIPTANRAIYTRFVPTQDVTVGTAYFRVATQSGSVSFAIYDSSTNPVRIATTGAFACPAGPAASQALTSPGTLVAGSAYYLGFSCSDNTIRIQGVVVTGAIFATGWNVQGIQETAHPCPGTATVTWESGSYMPIYFFK